MRKRFTGAVSTIVTILVILVSFYFALYNLRFDKHLVRAAYDGNPSAMRSLLTQGVSVNQRGINPRSTWKDVALSGAPDMSYTPLMAAVMAHRLGAVKVLVDHHADLDATNSQGRTALMLAATDNETDVVAYLLAHGANPKVADRSGWTALRLAALHDAFNSDTIQIKALLQRSGAK